MNGELESFLPYRVSWTFTTSFVFNFVFLK